jgi:HSP20 family protein
MAEAATKLPVQGDDKSAQRQVPAREWRPFENLRREMERVFEEFDWRNPLGRSAFDLDPPWRRELTWAQIPAVDVVENDKAYEVTAELPGLDEKNIEVKVANGTLTIRGEKKQEKEEKRKDYFVSERRYGSFERRFQIPVGVDTGKIEASFKKGVLTVTLPKTAEAQATAKTIAVKAE